MQNQRVSNHNIAFAVSWKFLSLVLVLLVSCEEYDTPKPIGYHRINILERVETRDTLYHEFSLSYPDYMKLEYLENQGQFNLQVPYYNATIHATFKKEPIEFGVALLDAIDLTMGHMHKSEGMRDKVSIDTINRVYSLATLIDGDVASTVQFVASDSVSRILRASLYYNHVPNADSLLPVNKVLVEDMLSMLSSLRWMHETSPER